MLTKLVNGVRVECTPEEEMLLLRERELETKKYDEIFKEQDLLKRTNKLKRQAILERLGLSEEEAQLLVR